MNAGDILDQHYQTLNSNALNHADRAQIYYTIIYTKKAENQSDLYVDIKEFLKNYLISVDERKFGYDHIETAKLISTINLLQPEEQINIWRFLKKLCIRHQCEEEWTKVEESYFRSRVEVLTSGNWWWLRPNKIFYFFYFKTIESYWSLFAILVGAFAISYVILLPNPGHIWPSLFRLTYSDANSKFWKNHAINVALNLFEFDSEFKVVPLNFVALILLILAKLVKVLFIVKYIVDKLIKKLSINE